MKSQLKIFFSSLESRQITGSLKFTVGTNTTNTETVAISVNNGLEAIMILIIIGTYTYCICLKGINANDALVL